MLDTASLHVAVGVLALTMLALFYFVTYRSTRSAFSAWWCVALGLIAPGASLDLFNGTPNQAWSIPLANALVVAGTAATWAGARSLRSASPRWWLVAAPSLVVGILSALGDPSTNVWAGWFVYLAADWIFLGLAFLELWRQQRAYEPPHTGDAGTYRLALRALMFGYGFVAVYLAFRWVAFIAVGTADPLFSVSLSDQTDALVGIVLLSTVSFSMSTLSTEQQTATLRETAAHDGLTGLLNRTEFLRRASEATREMHEDQGSAQLILADLDHFKQINDEQGHLAGDHAIETFSRVCRGAVRDTDLVGRYGGEEFILMLVGATPDRATQVTDNIDVAMAAASRREHLRFPTVSFGIATLQEGVDLERTIGYADSALYRAKAAGRNRSVHYFPGVS